MIKNKALLAPNEGWFLYNLAKETKGDIIEIGSYVGGSTIILAKGLKNPYKVYAIDPHIVNNKMVKKLNNRIVPKDTSQTFKNNVKKAKVKNKIILIEKTSEEARKIWNNVKKDKNKIRVVWIDGDHEYEGVKKDFFLWEPCLEKEGIIAFHDTCDLNKISELEEIKKKYPNNPNIFTGPARVVKEELCNSKRFGEIKKVDSIAYVRKIKNYSLKYNLKVIYLNNRNNRIEPVYSIDKTIGELGIILKKISPKIYSLLKNIMGSKK
jgi:predicted O-methyltransferase YrrM